MEPLTTPRARVVVVIPARGGSKGVRGKNLKRVGGRTLVERALDAALAADLVDEVCVSTDDEEIAATAADGGARVIVRPRSIAGDGSSSESVLLHALGELADEPDILVLVQATSPFIEPGDLDAAIARVRDGESDVVFSGVVSHGFLWRDGEHGVFGVNHDSRVRQRRQERALEYLETGAFYVMRTDGFRKTRHRFFGRVGISVVPARTAIEIDTVDDLDVARILAPFLDRAPAADARHGEDPLVVRPHLTEAPWSPSAPA